MKKLLSVLAVLFVIGTAKVFALGIGAQGGYTVNGAPSGAVTFKLNNVPCVFAVNADIGEVTSIGVTADWWIANPVITGPWCYYYGVGLAGSIAIGNSDGATFVGGRALVGTNVFLINKFLELYLQIAWQPGISIHDGIHPVYDQIPLNAGLRFWF